MAGKSLFKVEANIKSIEGMFRLADNVSKYPNRINRAKNIALEITKNEFRDKLVNNYARSRPRSYMYKDDTVMPVKVVHGGKKSYLEIRILRAQVTGDNKIEEKDLVNKARMDIQIQLYGRRAYSDSNPALGGDPRSYKMYDLTSNPHSSARNYPDTLVKFRVPKKSRNNSFYMFVMYEPAKILRKNLKRQLIAEGFGPRGGVTGIRGDVTPDQASSATAKYLRPDRR